MVRMKLKLIEQCQEPLSLVDTVTSTPEDAVHSQDYTKTSVVIVGAGIGGMCNAIDKIRQNKCRDFVILERSTGVGGTWHDKTYPGCAVDLQAIVYSYSFAPNGHWSRDFPGQKEILAYLTKVAQDYGLYDHIRFASTVEAASWDNSTEEWKTKIRLAPGAGAVSEYTLSSAFFVSAAGQLSQPLYPNISGADKYQGKTMHSARWDWTYDLKDKRIAVIGSGEFGKAYDMRGYANDITGCSAVQIIPEVAEVARQVTVFQRSPHWICPRGDRQKVYIDSHYLDNIDNNAVIINVHLCSHSEQSLRLRVGTSMA
jgi:cation diffusion facilitator CzcD-associated flavoprotein CzcO